MASTNRDTSARRSGTDSGAPKESPASLLACGVNLSSRSSIPLYHQLCLVLQRGIRELSLNAGDRFPPEEAVARAFSVSRPTANRAIQELISRGWLVRRRGRGTFVNRASPAQLSLLNSRLSFAEEMGEHSNYGSRIVSKRLMRATNADAEALAVPPDAPIVWFRRLHLIDQRAVMVCDSKLSAERFPNLEKEALSRGSLYKTLDQIYGCRVQRAERCAEAAELLDEQVAELLGVPLFAPIMLLTGLAFTSKGEVVEHMTAYVREGVVFKNVIVSDRMVDPLRDEACPRVRLAPDEAC